MWVVEEVSMADALERREQGRRETGASLMFIGLAVWVAGLLVLFFLPAGMKMGRETMFFAVIAGLAMLGALLMILGYIMRGTPDQ
jgi:hypothetical protein